VGAHHRALVERNIYILMNDVTIDSQCLWPMQSKYLLVLLFFGLLFLAFPHAFKPLLQVFSVYITIRPRPCFILCTLKPYYYMYFARYVL